MRLLFVILLLYADVADAADLKWGKTFRGSYHTALNGKQIGIGIKLPPKVEGLEKYPLVVALKGSLRVNPSRELPFFELRPSQGNIWGYRAVSAIDVMHAIAHMKEHYPIDHDRVYLIGSSAGGSGAMHLASLFPDQFAAVVPLVAAGNHYPIENFLNLPVVFYHGARDWTSAICDARVQYQKMRDFGCPVWLIEYQTAGHSIPRPHEPLMKWLLEQRRNTKPDRVTYVSETGDTSGSYWLRISELIDPHRTASIEGVVVNGEVRISATNVLSCSIVRPPVSRLRLGDQVVEGVESLNLVRVNGRWERAHGINWYGMFGGEYQSGAAANLYFSGVPLVLVYGTLSKDPRRIELLRQAAVKISACGGPDYGELRNRFVVVSDKEFTRRNFSGFNRILVGTPGDSYLIGEVSSRIPESGIQFLQNRVVSVLRPTHGHPGSLGSGRLSYLVMPFLEEGLDQFAENAQKFLVGADGFDRGSQGDCVVMDLEGRICRQRQFDKKWNWKHVLLAETPLPEGFGNRSSLALAHMRVMRRESKADFALWWGPNDKGMWGADFNFLKRYHPEECTRADLAIERRSVETMLGSVTGLELKEIAKRWVVKDELMTEPKIGEIDDARMYRLHLPMDLYIKLGQRRKNLRDPKPGPSIPTQDAVAELFR